MITQQSSKVCWLTEVHQGKRGCSYIFVHLALLKNKVFLEEKLNLDLK